MKIINLDSIDSTNTYLKHNYSGLDDLTFVSARYQTQGKGRNNRKWDSNDNNLLFSILLKDEKYFQLTNQLSIVSAYTILSVLNSYSINDLSIKWPNDIYVNDEKICGILLEAISSIKIDCLVIGVGINVNQEMFVDYDTKAISMKNVLNEDIDLDNLKLNIYQEFEKNLNKLVNGYDFYQEIVKYDYLKNKDVYALINNEKKLVKVKGINEDFTLGVINNNEEFNLNSGEISFHV